jgi:hypothetical protein
LKRDPTERKNRVSRQVAIGQLLAFPIGIFRIIALGLPVETA